jgi:hypothetical protein
MLLKRKALRQRIAKISRHESMDILRPHPYLNATTQRTILVPLRRTSANGP